MGRRDSVPYERNFIYSGDQWSPLRVILSFCRPSVNCVDSSPQVEPKKPLLEERWHEVTEWWYLSPINKTAYIPYYINIQKERNDIYGI